MASASEVYAGLPVTLTVTVSSEGDVPTGSVSIAQCDRNCDTSPFTTIGTVELIDGEASFTTNPLTGPNYPDDSRTYSFRATYLGDDNYSQSQSGLVEVTATPNATTTVVTSDINPSSLGEAVTFTATVTSQTGPAFISSSAPSSVTFFNGDTTIGSAGISNGANEFGSGNVAILTTDQLPTGTHNITARLQTNEPNFLPSTS
ncbi:Ig-like domain-containing protein, partial [Hyphobacterium sp. HN65]